MRRPLFILVLSVLAATSLLLGACWLTQQFCRAGLSRADELDWLRTEFQLDAAQLSRIRELHAGYLPRCEEFCRKIAGKQQELDQIITSAGADAPAVESRLTEIGVLRAQCQAAMLRHFVEVSRVMPADQGKRYLTKMERLTIGAHERIEATMTGGEADAHAHH